MILALIGEFGVRTVRLRLRWLGHKRKECSSGTEPVCSTGAETSSRSTPIYVRWLGHERKECSSGTASVCSTGAATLGVCSLQSCVCIVCCGLHPVCILATVTHVSVSIEYWYVWHRQEPVSSNHHQDSSTGGLQSGLPGQNPSYQRQASRNTCRYIVCRTIMI